NRAHNPNDEPLTGQPKPTPPTKGASARETHSQCIEHLLQAHRLYLNLRLRAGQGLGTELFIRDAEAVENGGEINLGCGTWKTPSV
ncbi:hypothetical protein ACIBI7_54425, partial [Nonomuraea fuscirosea]|uniref:hypothetical protein n=1 Tax=Nonomuraea fuscirosea TaxID=1291556 RepID=UPI0037B63E3D